MTIGRDIFQLGFDISPIILTGGVANGFGGLLPIVAITEPLNFATGILSGGTDLSLNNFFAHFKPLPGATLVDNQIGEYPFANQSVAANAIIFQPLRLSMLMICPAKHYLVKFATMIALQAVIRQHNLLGGLYTIVTPAGLWANCIMVGFRDVSGGESKQVQYEWQLDFIQPLVTLDDAEGALNTLMGKLDSGTETTNPSWSGLDNGAVSNGYSGVSPSLVPAGQPLEGVSAGGFGPPAPAPFAAAPPVTVTPLAGVPAPNPIAVGGL